MQTLRTSTKVGTIAGGFVLALAAGWVAVVVREKLTDGPEAQAASGMYAAGDMMLGIAVFGLLALVPFALGLYWLRPYAPFWRVLAAAAVLFALTGPLAVLASSGFREYTGGWAAVLAVARIGLMPLSAFALVTAGLFAPQPKPRWILLAAALADGTIFAGVVLVKFVLR